MVWRKKKIKNLTKTKVRGYQTQTKHDEYLRAIKKEEILKDGGSDSQKGDVKRWGYYKPKKDILKVGGAICPKKEIPKDRGIIRPKMKC